MSSHHIVREKQEPALLVLGLQQFSYELLGQLLEWSPTVIATTDTALKLNQDQIKIDWLIADEQPADLQLNVKLIPLNNHDALDTALKHLIVQGYSAVNIITDELILNDFLFYADKIDLVIYRGGKKIYPVKSGFSKWKPAGDVIELINRPENLAYTGLKPIAALTFETTHDGFFTLQFSRPYLLLAESV